MPIRKPAVQSRGNKDLNKLLFPNCAHINSHTTARKRPVILTRNEDLVRQAKAMTNNLSGIVDRLLVEFVSKERRERLAGSEAVEPTVALWNQFNA